jgi:hypothetical protein
MGFFDALAAVQQERTGDVPNHLKDGNRDGEGFGHGVGYLYPHAYRDHWVAQQYLPAGLQGQPLLPPPRSRATRRAIRDQVIQRRDAQLATAEVRGAEPLGLTTGVKEPQLDRFVERAMAGAAGHMAAVRTGLFERASVQRHHLVVELRARTGFLTWEAMRRAPEGLKGHPQPKKGVNPVGCLVFRLRMLALWPARSGGFALRATRHWRDASFALQPRARMHSHPAASQVGPSGWSQLEGRASSWQRTDSPAARHQWQPKVVQSREVVYSAQVGGTWASTT